LSQNHPELGRITVVSHPERTSSYEDKKLYLATYCGKRVYLSRCAAGTYFKALVFHWRANPIDVMVFRLDDVKPKEWAHERIYSKIDLTDLQE